jgi:O-succinylbenzoic acid--CoA ligase
MKFWEINKRALGRDAAPDGPYFDKAYQFMKNWKEGQEELMISTSGSTGIPKLISVSRERLKASARLTGKALELGEGTQALVCLNINYIGGIMMLVRGMELNWEMTIIEPVSNPFLELPDNFHFDFSAMVPMQLAAILENNLTELKINSIDKLMLGGAPVSVSLQKQIEKLETSVYLSYGMTETVSHVALRRLNGPDASDDYVLLDEVVAGVDDRNCLHVKGPMTDEEVIQTNDLVEIVSERSFKWLGRADSIINSGGVKIQLDKIDRTAEEIMAELGWSNLFFSWYEKDEKLGQKLILVIESTRSVLDGYAVLVKMRERLTPYEVPKHVYFAKQFEFTGSGKIDRIATSLKLKNVNERDNY